MFFAEKSSDKDPMLEYVIGDMTFYIDPKQEALKHNLIFIDDMLNAGMKLKDSRTTTAAVLELPGMKPVFVKRENNKGLKFTLKYLFRCSRVFRAAAAAAKLEELGVPTPKVLAVGSRRSRGVLKSGYLITETLTKVLKTEAVCNRLNNNPQFYESFMTEVSRMVGTMHENGVSHGDLKLSNIYCKDSSNGYKFGLIDLDGTHMHHGKVSQHQRTQELARIVSSYARTSYESCGKAIDIKSVSSKLVEQYHQHTAVKPDPESVVQESRGFLRRYGLEI